MLSSRKALISNLNYVHLQQKSLGAHLSMRSDLKEVPVCQDTALKDLTGCHHQWKGTSDIVLVDANSNDPSVPCQCCDQHSGHEESLQYSSIENLEAITCDDYLSPDDLPLSPLSPSSPSTDSSSSSDFTLDDSPVSMYYREYAEENLETPDQEPNIIPLDAEFLESVASLPDNSLYPPSLTANIVLDSERSLCKSPEHTGNNIGPDDLPFIDWSSETILDSNCNTLVDAEQSNLSSLSSTPMETIRAVDLELQTNAAERQDVENANHNDFPLWSVDGDLLPGLSVLEDSSTLTPKKTITSFHELAQKRRKSGAQLSLQTKRDKSDWLIVFSPDTEQPPVNELTTSAFYHTALMPHTQPLPEGKEVTTFRELRYRNTIYKQSGQQAKENNLMFKGHETSTEEISTTMEIHHMREEPTNSSPFIIRKEHFQDVTTRDDDKLGQTPLGSNKEPDEARRLQKPDLKTHQMSMQEVPQRLSSQNNYQPSALVEIMSAMTERMEQQGQIALKSEVYSRKKESPEKEKQARVRRRGLADGGDYRGLEVFGAPSSTFFLRFPTNQTSPTALSPYSSTLEIPRYFTLPPQAWTPRLPARLSPVGASSPPQRALLPLLDIPDVAILLSPLFPRTWSRGTGPSDTPSTGADGKPLMADGEVDSAHQKKNLLISIGTAVDKIIGHFNGSRNQVQKAQLGDSRLSPKLGYLILNTLCPSLYSLIGDGLKSFQKDVIIGRRRLSPWNLVEASTKTGPEPLHILFYNISHLQQLRDPQKRFNAFIFGLLNTKQLDIWVSHLHQIYDELSSFYLPMGFLPLAATSRPDLREELLLILQPLSALTFHADLLFEHHHLLLQDPPTRRDPQTPSQTDWGVPSFQHILDLGGWLAHNLTGSADKGTQKSSQSHSQSCTQDFLSSISDSQLDGATCSKDFPEDSLFCDTSLNRSSPSTGVTLTPTQTTSSKTKDFSNTWWGHLSQASHMYIPAKKESFAFSSLKKLTTWGTPEHRDQSNLTQQMSLKQRESAEQRLHERSSCGSQKTNNENELPKLHIEVSKDPATTIISSNKDQTLIAGDTAAYKEPDGMNGNTTSPTQNPKEEKVHWFGQLFGANLAHSQDSEAKNVKSRRPSSWLPPNVNVLNLIRKISTPEREEISPEEEKVEQETDGKHERSLRALCDHAASGDTQLSFKKGDILQLLGTVDEDWIRCKRGSDMGLVPVGYTSLIL